MVHIISLNTQIEPAGKYKSIIFPKLVWMRNRQLREVRIRSLGKGVTSKLGLIGTKSTNHT